MPQMVTTERSFIGGVLVPPGFSVNVPDHLIDERSTNLADPGSLPPMAVVEIAALGPTGPNPQVPQQLAPDMIQTGAGTYAKPGAMLVGERTVGQDARLADLMDVGDTSEGDFATRLAELRDENARLRAGAGQDGGDGNDDDALVSGNARDIVASLGEKTDAELAQLRAAEVDRQKPRKTVTAAIDEELQRRAAMS